MEEILTKITQDLDFVTDGLLEALQKCGNVEGLMILAINRKANELRRDVEGLLCAHIADNGEVSK